MSKRDHKSNLESLVFDALRAADIMAFFVETILKFDGNEEDVIPCKRVPGNRILYLSNDNMENLLWGTYHIVERVKRLRDLLEDPAFEIKPGQPEQASV